MINCSHIVARGFWGMIHGNFLMVQFGVYLIQFCLNFFKQCSILMKEIIMLRGLWACSMRHFVFNRELGEFWSIF